MSTATENTLGRVTQVIGSTFDIEFPEGHMPPIYNAVHVKSEHKGVSIDLTGEIQQHLGGGRVRAIALGSTEGMMRGMEVVDTGKPVSVPVGTAAASTEDGATSSPAADAGMGIWANLAAALKACECRDRIGRGQPATHRRPCGGDHASVGRLKNLGHIYARADRLGIPADRVAARPAELLDCAGVGPSDPLLPVGLKPFVGRADRHPGHRRDCTDQFV